MTTALFSAVLFTASAAASDCGADNPAQQLIAMIQTHEQQQRPTLQCDPTLNRIAAKKLEALVASPTFWHQAGRMTPNQWLRHHGYVLSPIYPILGNQVEALAGGETTAEQAFQAFLGSSSHRQLLLGNYAFYVEQNQIGAAYIKVPKSDHVHYWAVLIADQNRVDTNLADQVNLITAPQANHQPKEKRVSVSEKMYRKRVKKQWRQ